MVDACIFGVFQVVSSRSLDVSLAATVWSTLRLLVTPARMVLWCLAANAVLLAGISLALALPVVVILASTAYMGIGVWDKTKQVRTGNWKYVAWPY